jgi:hypothetical protein
MPWPQSGHMQYEKINEKSRIGDQQIWLPSWRDGTGEECLRRNWVATSASRKLGMDDDGSFF